MANVIKHANVANPSILPPFRFVIDATLLNINPFGRNS